MTKETLSQRAHQRYLQSLKENDTFQIQFVLNGCQYDYRKFLKVFFDERACICDDTAYKLKVLFEELLNRVEQYENKPQQTDSYTDLIKGQKENQSTLIEK